MSDLPSRGLIRNLVKSYEAARGDMAALPVLDGAAFVTIARQWVSGRLIDRKALEDVAYLDGDGAWKIDLDQLGGSDDAG